MLSVLKTLAASTLLGALASVFGDTASTIILLSTALAGFVYLVKALMLAAKFLRHWIRTVQVIHAIPPWMESINGHVIDLDSRLDRLEQKADAIREPAEAVARELDASHRRSSA